MKYIRFKCAVILFSAFILAVNGVWKLGLTVSASSRVSIYSLWDYTGVHCDKGNVLYRHSFLDNFTRIAHCFNAINVLLVVSNLDYNIFSMKLIPTSGDISLESLLLKSPSDATLWKTNVDISSDPCHQHLINTDNFEFIWLNAAKTVMYAGMYYNPVDPNSPKFSFSVKGVNYTAGGNSSHVLSDDDVKYLEMQFAINTKDTCKGIINDNTPQNCPGPDVSIQVNETDIPAGSQAAISCTMMSPLGIVSVNWTLNDTDIDLSKAKYEGIVHGTHTLKINDFQSDDSGRYRCIAATAMGTGQSQERQIQMIGPPSITVPTQEYRLTPGTDMTLACTVQANPAVMGIFWKKNGVTILASSKYAGATLVSPSLTISNPDESDLGIYECCATNSFNTETRVCGEDTIMIKDDPSVQILTKKYEYILGDAISLNCNFTSYPEVQDVYWEKNGSRLSISGQLTYSNFSGSPVLQLNNLVSNDRGSYTCCVENIISTRCGEDILLGGKPTVSVLYSSIIATRNIKNTIFCDVDAYPNAVTVSWNITLDDTVVVHTGAATGKYDAVSPSSPKLIVKAPGFADNGVYVCIAENEFGFGISAEVTFSVYGVIVEAPVLKYNVIYSESVELNCTVTYAPDLLSVTWIRATNPVSVVDMNNTAKYTGSRISNPHLIIHNVVTADADEYYCKASNAYDEMESSHIKLSVNGAAPTVTISQSEITVNTSNDVTLSCTYTGAIPNVTSVKWYKEVNGVVSEIVTSPSTPSLTITSVVMADAGHYTCSATNAVGQRNSSSTVELRVNQVQPMCPCDCAYKKRLDYWASQDVPNHTMAEWREILAPVLDEIKKNLTVNKANLSATIRKLSSAPDERQSSKSVGFIGIALISFVCASFILIDITSIRRHLAVIREMIGHGNAIE